MSLIKYEPVYVLNRLRDQLNRMYDPDYYPSMWDEESGMVVSDWSPAVDVREDGDKYVFIADVPGVDPKDIDVTCENGVLSIRGEKKTEAVAEKEGYRRVERSRGNFYRRFSLPDNVDTDKIRANVRHGVLELTIPKLAKVKPKKIEIRA